MRARAKAIHPPQHRLQRLAVAGAVALAAALLVTGLARGQDTVAVGTANGDLGTYLVDEAGLTLYYFEPDPVGASVCEGDCLAAWPALSVGDGQSVSADPEAAGTFSSFERSDGGMQVTYRGRPLYYFVGDQAAGDVNGHAVSDVWWVATVDGSLPNAEPASDPALTLAATTTDLGTFIIADGITTYYFSPDQTPGVSVCSDDCLAAWPPVTVEEGGEIAAADGVDGVVGVTTATDGSPQVTYDGRPLYYFAGDQAAGDVNGHAVSDVWWVATTDGLLP